MIHSFLSFLFPPSCLSCRTPGVPLCDACLKRSRQALSSPAPFILSFFDYQDPLIKRSIHAMKFFGRKDIAETFSFPLATLIRGIPEYQSYVLVPIPMPRIRKYMRGYNQSEALASYIAVRCEMPLDSSLLIRKTAPARQVRVASRHRRLLNQRGTFSSGDAAGERILLIDDVTTTGATLTEARNVLLRAGAREVRALTIAH